MLRRFLSSAVLSFLLTGLSAADTYTSFLPNSPSTACAGSPSSESTTCLKDCTDSCADDPACVGVNFDRDATDCVLVGSTCSISGYSYYGKTARDLTPCDLGANAKEFSLIFVIDESGSVGLTNYGRLQEFVTDVTVAVSNNSQQVLINTTVFEFAVRSRKEEDITTFTEDICAFEDNLFNVITYNGGGTNIEDGLRVANQIRMDRHSPGEAVVVVLLTDGKPTTYGSTTVSYNSNQARVRARQRAQAISDLPNTHLIYGAIAGAVRNLFDGIDHSLIDIPTSGTWDLTGFVDTLESRIGEVVCFTNRPTRAPTSKAPSGSPTRSPTRTLVTRSPTRTPTTLSPTQSPTLFNPADTCSVINSGDTTIQFPDPEATTIEAIESKYFFSANAAPGVSELTLTDGVNNMFTSNYIFHRTKDNLVGGFISNFVMEVRSPDPLNDEVEGFAFVMHDRPEGLVNIPQATGQGLGFASISRSVAIVVDLCADRNVGARCGEVNLYFNYNTDNPAAIPSRPLKWQQFLLQRRDTGVYNITVTYVEQAELIELRIDGEVYVLQYGVNLRNILGSNTGYLGFTTASESVSFENVLTYWDLKTVTIDYDLTSTIDLDENKTLVANNRESAGFSIQTYDRCKYGIDYGGFAGDMEALFIEEVEEETGTYANGSLTPAIISGTIKDNDDGTYTGLLSTTHGNSSFAVYLAYGKGCNLEMNEIPPVGDSPGSATASLAPGNTTSCLFASRANALTTVAPQVIEVPDNGPGSDKANGDDSPIEAIAGAGGAAGAFLIIAALAALRLRRRWQRDKAYVDEGNLAILERDVEYTTNFEYDAVSMGLQQTQDAILREKAKGAKPHRESEIHQLQQENAALSEQIKANKQAQQQSDKPRASIMSPLFKLGRKKEKKEFGGDIVKDL